eukprot:1196112-Prorocentrum_minimum.AAC.6
MRSTCWVSHRALPRAPDRIEVLRQQSDRCKTTVRHSCRACRWAHKSAEKQGSSEPRTVLVQFGPNIAVLPRSLRGNYLIELIETVRCPFNDRTHGVCPY